MDKKIIEQGMFVKYSYTLKDAETGDILFVATKEEPDEMVYGVSQEIIPGLISTLKGLAAGDKFEVTLPPEAAFGPRYDENVIALDKDIFMRDGRLAEEVKVGAELPMMTAEGFRVLGRVIEVAEKIKMDFNHPFAGKQVTYIGEVEEVREATPEELSPNQGGCGGCCGGNGGGCGDNGCGDNGCGEGCCK